MFLLHSIGQNYVTCKCFNGRYTSKFENNDSKLLKSAVILPILRTSYLNDYYLWLPNNQ